MDTEICFTSQLDMLQEENDSILEKVDNLIFCGFHLSPRVILLIRFEF